MKLSQLKSSMTRLAIFKSWQPRKQLTISALVFCCRSAFALYADSEGNNSSKRIEVYALTQNIWEVAKGDTLSRISQQLLSNNPAQREALQQDIIRLYPAAFINDNPSLLIAGKRLKLPVYMKQADSKIDPKTIIVETYSWGNVKRQKD